MEFESAQAAAERLGVTVRAIQKWAKDGLIPGAQKAGRDWQIPKEATRPKDASEVTNGPKPKVLHVTLPLLNSAFSIGHCREYIESIPDEDDRKIALGEYYFYSGQAEKAAKIFEPYLDSEDTSLKYSASFMYFFTNLSRGHIHLARFGLDVLKKDIFYGIEQEKTELMNATAIFTGVTASVLMHIPTPEMPPLSEYIKHLPQGIRLYACYVLAYEAYLDEDYSRSLAIADIALCMTPEVYPIACIYLHTIAAMNLMNMKRVEEAKKRFMTAWELAQPDDLIECFAEHHGLLQGILEVVLKKKYAQDFERIITVTRSFNTGWRNMYSMVAKKSIADNLTTMEFTIAMLYNRGWTVKEIAAHMEVSDRTVNNYIQIIYAKLGITGKKELAQFMQR